MKTKHLLSFFSFAAAFALSVSLCGLSLCHQKTDARAQQKIAEFLQRDAANIRSKLAKLQMREVDSTPNRADAIADYAADSEKLSLANLPEDFQIAWLRHNNASREIGDFVVNLRKYKSGILDEKDAAIWREMCATDDAANENVVAVAENYGVEYDKRTLEVTAK